MTEDQLWQKLAQAISVVAPFLARRVAYHQNNLPDSRTQPVSFALVKSFLSQIERHLAAIRAGVDGMKREFGDDPVRPGRLLKETLEMESWLIPKRKPDSSKLTERIEDAMGNMFVSVGKMSYAEARFVLREMQQFSATHRRGAPSKRPETLKLLDARIANRWSYARLASKMCDCGATQHGELCRERIRKRLKELESYLKERNIQYGDTPGE
jgi:hypothetical protein